MKLPRGKTARASVLILAMAVTVSALSAGPYIAESPPELSDYPEYAVSDLAAQPIESQGQPSPDITDREGLVVIDASHANHYQKREIQALVSAISATGYRVEFLDRGDSLSSALSRADGFVVIAPGQPVTRSEANQIEEFVDRGGRLVLFGEPTQFTVERAGLRLVLRPVDNEMDALASRFGLDFSERHLYNMEHNDGNYLDILAAGTNRRLSQNVTRTVFSTAAAVEVRDGSPVIVAMPRTRSDRADSTGRYVLAARSGNVLAVGDSTFLTEEKYSIADNDAFIANIAEFLVTGNRERTLLDYPAIVSQQPTIHYTSADLLDAAKTVSDGLASERAGRPTVALATDGVSTDSTDVLITTFDWLRTNPIRSGIGVRGRTVSVATYEADRTGVYVIHAPESGFDVIIAADTAGQAEQAAAALATGTFESDAITNDTVVVNSAN